MLLAQDGGQVGKDLIQLGAVGPSRERGVLGTLELRGGHELHRARDLLDVAHRGDAAPDLALAGHLDCAPSDGLGEEGLTDAAMASSSAPARSSLSALDSPSSWQDLGPLHLQEAVEAASRTRLHARRGHVIELAVRGGVEDRHLLLNRQRLVLRLLDHLGELLAARELVAGGLVEVTCELGEGGQSPVLGQVELERRGDLLHGLGLGSRAHAARPRCPR